MRAGPETYVCVYSAILIIFSFLPCCRRRWLLNMLMHMDAFRALFLDLCSFLALVTYIHFIPTWLDTRFPFNRAFFSLIAAAALDLIPHTVPLSLSLLFYAEQCCILHAITY